MRHSVAKICFVLVALASLTCATTEPIAFSYLDAPPPPPDHSSELARSALSVAFGLLATAALLAPVISFVHRRVAADFYAIYDDSRARYSELYEIVRRAGKSRAPAALFYVLFGVSNPVDAAILCAYGIFCALRRLFRALCTLLTPQNPADD